MSQRVKAFKCQRTGRTFNTEALARASENVLNKAKLETLQKRIASKKYWVPKVHEYVYVQTMISCDHGWDDVRGGLAEVTKISYSMSGGNPKCVYIEIMQHERGGNWTQFLFPEQKRLMKEFGDTFAHPDPDYGPGGNQYDPHEWH